MKTRLKMFVFLVALGSSSSMLFLYLDWGLYGQCFEEGLFPSFSDNERCSRLFENTIPQAFALIIAYTPEELLEVFPTIVFAEIVDYDDLDRRSVYHVKVIEYIKNPQEQKMLEVIGYGVHHDRIWVEDQTVFEIGDRAVLYLDDDENQLQIAPYSFVTQNDITDPYWYKTNGLQEPIPQPVLLNSKNEQVIPPPLKQVKLGVKIGLIICDEDKILTYNVHYKPVCVFTDTEQKLIDRGWAKLRLLLPASPFPENEMELTGRNVMSMMLEGTVIIGENRLETYDEKRAAVWEYAQQYYPGETFLEYSIILPGDRHYNVGENIAFDLLEWGNYSECWDLNLRIFDVHDDILYEDNLNKGCLEPDGIPGTFNSYSVGKDFELVCQKPGYYRIEVSNGEIYSATILQNFACLDIKLKSEDGYGLPDLSDPNRFTEPEPDSVTALWLENEN